MPENRIPGILPAKKVYRFNQFVRWLVLVFAVAASAYAVWVAFNKIGADTKIFFKIVPFIIVFLAVNTIIKNLFSINTVRFTAGAIQFGFIGRAKVVIPWESMKKMEFVTSRQRLIRITYDKNGNDAVFTFTTAFPKILEILNGILGMKPDIEMDEFLDKVLVGPPTYNIDEKEDK